MSILPSQELLNRLSALAESEGLHADPHPPDRLTAERDIPMGKWFLGGRKAVYQLSCSLDEASHDVRFRESTTETSWGVPPPTFTTEVTSQSGSATRQSTKVRAPGGGGRFDIGHVREEIEAAVGGAGWQFHLEAGRRP